MPFHTRISALKRGMKKIRVGLWVLVVILAVGFIALNLPSKKSNEADISVGVAGFNQGAHFALIDQNGAPFDSAEKIIDGHYALLFFGFTHCPAICPTELQKMAEVMDSLSPDVAAKITPIFMTIDPERDTVDDMHRYVPQFHEKIVGLTGDVDAVHKTLKNWKVFYTKVNDPAYEEYTMDHSTYSYLVDQNMKIVALYRLKNTAAEITNSIEGIVQ